MWMDGNMLKKSNPKKEKVRHSKGEDINGTKGKIFQREGENYTQREESYAQREGNILFSLASL